MGQYNLCDDAHGISGRHFNPYYKVARGSTLGRDKTKMAARGTVDDPGLQLPTSFTVENQLSEGTFVRNILNIYNCRRLRSCSLYIGCIRGGKSKLD